MILTNFTSASAQKSLQFYIKYQLEITIFTSINMHVNDLNDIMILQFTQNSFTLCTSLSPASDHNSFHANKIASIFYSGWNEYIFNIALYTKV